MNRRTLLQRLGIAAGFVSLGSAMRAGAETLGAKAIELKEAESNQMYDFVVHVPNPTTAALRQAAQSLAGRNCYPFQFPEKHFRGYINRDCLGDGRILQNPDGNSVIEWLGTGITFQVVPFVKGAIVFSPSSPFLSGHSWQTNTHYVTYGLGLDPKQE